MVVVVDVVDVVDVVVVVGSVVVDEVLDVGNTVVDDVVDVGVVDELVVASTVELDVLDEVDVAGGSVDDVAVSDVEVGDDVEAGPVVVTTAEPPDDPATSVVVGWVDGAFVDDGQSVAAIAGALIVSPSMTSNSGPTTTRGIERRRATARRIVPTMATIAAATINMDASLPVAGSTEH